MSASSDLGGDASSSGSSGFEGPVCNQDGDLVAQCGDGARCTSSNGTYIGNCVCRFYFTGEPPECTSFVVRLGVTSQWQVFVIAIGLLHLCVAVAAILNVWQRRATRRAATALLNHSRGVESPLLVGTERRASLAGGRGRLGRAGEASRTRSGEPEHKMNERDLALVCTALASALRVVFFVDPVDRHEIYPYWIREPLLKVPQVLLMTAVLFIVLVWLTVSQSMHTVGGRGDGRSRRCQRVVVIASICVLLFVSVTTSVLFAASVDRKLMRAAADGVFAVFIVFLMLGGTVFALRTLRILVQSRKKSKSGRQAAMFDQAAANIQRTLWALLVLGSFVVGSVVCLLYLGWSPHYDPVKYLYCLLCIHGLCEGGAVIVILHSCWQNPPLGLWDSLRLVCCRGSLLDADDLTQRILEIMTPVGGDSTRGGATGYGTRERYGSDSSRPVSLSPSDEGLAGADDSPPASSGWSIPGHAGGQRYGASGASSLGGAVSAGDGSSPGAEWTPDWSRGAARGERGKSATALHNSGGVALSRANSGVVYSTTSVVAGESGGSLR